MKAIFAGTFDPFTVGHMDIAMRALAMFGNVTVAVAADTGKNCAKLSEREHICNSALSSLVGAQVVTFDGLLTDFIKSQGECVLIRGLRSAADFEYERDLTRVYSSLAHVQSLFLISSAGVEHVSSSVVRALAKYGNVDGYAVNGTENLILSIYGKAK